MTPKIIDLIAQISERVGRLTAYADYDQALHLRRVNRIRSIQGSLAIEGNTLSEQQITAILDGKRVIAPPREVQEVKNAICVYDQLKQWQPCSEIDLLQAHQMLMAVMRGEMSREALQHVLGLRDRKSFRERYLKPALAQGMIEMTYPDKPNSKLQKYRRKV